MATATEITLFNAVAAAEAVRQTSYASALTTWAFQQGAPFTTYIQALASADQAYALAVKNAAATANLSDRPYRSGPWPNLSVSPNNPLPQGV